MIQQRSLVRYGGEQSLSLRSSNENPSVTVMDPKIMSVKQINEILNKNLSPKKYGTTYQTKNYKRRLLPQTIPHASRALLVDGDGINKLHLKVQRYSNNPSHDVSIESAQNTT